MKTKLLLIGSLGLALGLAVDGWAQGEPREAMPERVPQEPARPIPVPLSLAETNAFVKGRNFHEMAAPNAAEVTAADAVAFHRFAVVQPGPKRVGLVRSVGARPLSPRNGSAARQARTGGRSTWTLAVRSTGAAGVRLHLTDTDLGDGTMLLFVQGKGKDGPVVRGPYTGKGPNHTGDFWTESLPGDTVHIEVSGSAEPKFEVQEVMHLDKDPEASAQGGNSSVADLLGCHIDAMCPTTPAIPPAARDAVGRIYFISGGAGFVCSGTLLNDFDGETVVPYFLTANHCINTQAEADSMEVVYLWQTDSCGGALPSFNSLPRSLGGTLLEHSSDNDRSFIRLNGSVPGGVGIAGWTTTPISGTAIGVHHPGGSYKRTSLMHEVNDTPYCASLPFWEYHYLQVDQGMNEPGSSGSGLFNAQGQVMGQLYGSCGDTAGCNNRGDWRAVYGEFEETYPLIRLWMEIGGTIHVDRAYSGTEEGTPSKPFNTVIEGNDFAWNGARIKIKPASYPEAVTINKAVTLLADGGPVTIGR